MRWKGGWKSRHAPCWCIRQRFACCRNKKRSSKRKYRKGASETEEEEEVKEDIVILRQGGAQKVAPILEGVDVDVTVNVRVSNHAVKENKVVPFTEIRGRAFFLLSNKNSFRLAIAKMTISTTFDRLIILFIVIGCVLLALDSPGLDADTVHVLGKIDIGMTVLFTIEMVMKSITYQFVIGKDSYLKNGWNVMDFIIVITSILDMLLGDLKFFRTFRILRILRSLRALRMLSHLQRLRLVVRSLFATFQALTNVMMIASLFTTIFSILGVNLFKGKMHRCQDLLLKPLYGVSKAECFDMQALGDPVIWANSPWSCDHVGQAWLLLFEVASLEMWPTIMYEFIDHTGTPEDMGPERDSNQAAAGFFVAYIMVGSFFVVGLFVGVVVDQYNKQYEKFTGVLSLTESQEHYLQSYKDMVYNPPKLRLLPPRSSKCGSLGLKFRKLMFKIALSKQLEITIVASILLNVFVMALAYYEMPAEYSLVLDYINEVFSWIFISEMLIKLFGLGWKQYRQSSWNMFDFVIVNLSIFSMVLKLFDGAGLEIDASFLRVFRIFRILRIFRLVRRFKGLNALIQTLVFSFPALYNVGTLLFLLYFMFAVTSMYLFGETEHRVFINDYANFENFPIAMITLFRMSTGESWNGAMHELMSQTGNKFDYICTLAFFASFTFASNFLLLNVFVAVVLKNFEEEVMSDSANTSNPFVREAIVRFGDYWASRFDSYTISSKELKPLLMNLPAPWTLPQSTFRPGKYIQFLSRTMIPIYEGKIHCLDVCLALCTNTLFIDKTTMDHGIAVDNELLTASKIQAYRSYPELKKRKLYFYDCAEYHASSLVQTKWRTIQARDRARLEGVENVNPRNSVAVVRRNSDLRHLDNTLERRNSDLRHLNTVENANVNPAAALQVVRGNSDLRHLNSLK